MKRLLALGAVSALAFAGCGGCGGIKEGTVESKHYEEANTYVYFIPICTTTGGQYPTTTCTPIPYYMYDDEDWVLHLVKGTEENDVYVNEDIYNETEIGSYFGGEGPHVEYEDEDVKKGKA